MSLQDANSHSPQDEPRQTLTMSDGTQYGTVVAEVEAHQFPDGTVEPGVLVDYGPRIPGQQNWLPTRSAQTIVQ